MKNIGGKLPQFMNHRIGLRRVQSLGLSTGSALLYSNTAMLCHVTYERHLQPQSARTIVLPVLQPQPGNSRLHCRHSTGHSNPAVKAECSNNNRRMLQECKPGSAAANALSQCLPQGLLITSWSDVRDRGREEELVQKASRKRICRCSDFR